MGGGRGRSKSKSKSKKKKLSGRERAQQMAKKNISTHGGTASAARANKASSRASAAARHAASQAAKSDKAMSKAGVSGVGPVASGRTYATALKNTTQGIGPVSSGSDYARSLETAKKQQEATRKSTFDSGRLNNSFDSDAALNYAKGLNLFSTANMVAPGQNLSSWYNQGSAPNKSFKQVLGDEWSMRQRTQGLGKGSWNPARGMPGYGTVKNILTGKKWNTPHEGGFESGPTEANRRVLNNLSKAYIGAQLFKQGQTGSITDQIANQTIGKINPYAGTAGTDQFSTEATAARKRGPLLSIGNFKVPEFGISEYMGINTADRSPKNVQTDAGGLNIGKTPSETEGGRNIRSLKQVTDVGEKRNETTDERVNSLLTNAFNIGTKIPFVGPQLQNLKSDIKPYTDRITVETPRNTKKVISEFIGNLDSKSDTTRRFVNEFTTDNPNIPNRFGLETAADVVQTLNPTNKNFAPQLSTSWSKPLQAIANNLVSGGTKNIFQEAALNTGAEGTISPAEGLSIARRIGQNINTPGTLGNFEATKIKNLADQYGGGTIKPTPGTIFRGITGGGRGGTSVGRGGGGGSLPSVAAAALQQPQPVEEIPLPTNADLPNLKGIQQQAYNQQMSIYGVPNYTAQIQPTQNVRPLRRRQYFNRDYFTQFA